MTSILKYVCSEEMMRWLQPPEECGDVAQVVMREVEGYVVEMEGYLTEIEGGKQRWEGAQCVVRAQILEKGGGDSMTVTEIKRKAKENIVELQAEAVEVEGSIRYHVSQVILTNPPPASLPALLSERLRTKVHRLVELPLWIKAAQSITQTG